MNAVKKYNEQLEKIKKIGKKSNLELEIRKEISIQSFLEVYENNKTKPKVLKTSFSRSDSVVREESFYDLGEKKEKESMMKEKIHTEPFEGFNLNISVETKTDKVVTAIKYSRIKFRWSFDILPKWIMDLTISIKIDSNKVVEMVKYYLFGQKRTEPEDILTYITESTYYVQKPTILSTDIEFEYFSDSPISESDLRDIREKISTMNGVSNQNEKNLEITEKISKILYPKMQNYTNLKEMLYNPVTLDRRAFLEIKPNLSEYTVAPKNDGERTLIIYVEVPTKTIIILNSTELVILGDQEPEIKYGSVKYIIDSEVLSNGKIYAFDLIYDGTNLIESTKTNYLDRFAMLSNIEKDMAKILEILNNDKKYTFSLNNVRKFSDISQKEFYNLAEAKSEIKNIDGLILTHFTDPRKVYKWKPLEHNTIDFLIIAADPLLIGKYGYEKTDKKAYILCSGIAPDDRKILGLDQHLFDYKSGNVGAQLQYVPFISSLDRYSYVWYSDRTDLDMKIGEFRLLFNPNNENREWKLVRERPDRDRLVKLGRYYGNYYRVAEMTYLYYFNPVMLPQFFVNELNYFQVNKKDEYKTMIGFNNFVKENVLSQVKNTHYLIDLSCGKGQDIFRYNLFGVRNLLAVDRDSDAIAELINRKYSLGNPNYYKYNRNTVLTLRDFTFIQARICDLSQSVEHIMGVLKPEIKAKFVTMNLAIHYLLNDRKSLIQFSKHVDGLLDNGGTFIFSTFCGEKLMTDFNKYKKEGNPQKIEFSDNKFNITRVTEPGIKGDKIDVLHPFSNEVYRENIVNISEVISQFESLGFRLRQRVYFSEFITKYSDSDKLTEDEKRYVDYYVYVSLVKD